MKKIEINLKDTMNVDLPPFEMREPILCKNEYPYLFLDQEISEEDLNKALDVIITFFMQKEINNLIVNLDERNDYMTPTKEMTIDEIEKQLGHKVKIVKQKEEE